MNQGRIFEGIENSVHAVFHRQDKTGGQLPQLRPAFIRVGELGRNLNSVIIL